MWGGLKPSGQVGSPKSDLALDGPLRDACSGCNFLIVHANEKSHLEHLSYFRVIFFQLLEHFMHRKNLWIFAVFGRLNLFEHVTVDVCHRELP